MQVGKYLIALVAALDGVTRAAGGSCAQRRVYIDLGVNWCNTIHQFRAHEPPMAAASWGAWEVYGLEASPLIQPYVEDHLAWLDGRRSDAPVARATRLERNARSTLADGPQHESGPRALLSHGLMSRAWP